MQYLVLLNIVIFMASHITALDESCPALLTRYSKQHTCYKPPDPQCGILQSSLTEKDAEVILKEHNIKRSKLATGQEGKMPAASNMLQMVWDKELANVAQHHANQCVFEHDCSNCRRVRNFAVGQNLATEYVTNSPTIPEPNWPLAIKNWYDEIEFFQINAIDPFLPPPPPPASTYGHFTQVVWAESWRIGCGYVLYKEEENTYKKLYVCDYGPAGNVNPGSMYKQGPQCSACPVNSCCDKTCNTTAGYPGLCKITDNKAPINKPKGTYLFYCNFQNQPDCAFANTTGAGKWTQENTLSGSLLGIILKGGEQGSITFDTKLKPQTNSFCFVIIYSKGPNRDGDEESNTAKETFTIVSNNYDINQDLPSFPGSLRHQPNQYSMNLGWNYETQVKLAFSVPAGKPDQFFEIKEIYAHDGQCKT